ncbi:MAG: nitrile hydratase accessory protein [Actinomycetia bacterium]|nr:nitrile hydratase accessory protein [Actinomycetes bacterium]
MSEPSAVDLPSLPRDDEGPVFAEPWQAQAFAMVVRLHEQGLFEWSEWAATLGAEFTAAGPDDTLDYWRHWQAALEKLVTNKGMVGPGELVDRRHAWDRAAKATPHGQPITLDAAG